MKFAIYYGRSRDYLEMGLFVYPGGTREIWLAGKFFNISVGALPKSLEGL